MGDWQRDELRVFVYGTLMQGGRYHARYAGGFTSACPASIRGRLYDLPYGYPMLVVPPGSVLKLGSADRAGDLARFAKLECNRSTPRPSVASADGWNTVVGEVLTFADAVARLAALDELEGFEPPGLREYDRAIVEVDCAEGPCLVWSYVAPGGRLPAGARLLPAGRWGGGSASHDR